MSQQSSASFLGLEGCHVFVTGAAGGVGRTVVDEFLQHGCFLSAFDKIDLDLDRLSATETQRARVHSIRGDLRDESSLSEAFAEASRRFGPPQILVANAGITDESSHPPVWELETERWDAVHAVNVRGTFLTIKHFLLCVKSHQDETRRELDNVAIVLTGSETGVFGQAGHAEYASGKAGLQYGLVKTVKNEIVRLNSRARVNAVAPGWINTALIGDRLDDPGERWAEAEATVALRKIAEPEDVSRCVAFLASHRVAGHITGQCVSIDGGQEGRLVWKQHEATGPLQQAAPALRSRWQPSQSSSSRRRRLRICLSVDFDAVSGLLGTGHSAENTLVDYSAGFFGANAGVDRLLDVFKKRGIAQNVTWFIPGHSMESFPRQTRAIVQSGAEVGLHGYSHESTYALSEDQEREVLEHCIALATDLCDGKRPTGYRAPLYQIRESTLDLLRDHGLLYDSSLNSHDSQPYFLSKLFEPESLVIPDYTKPASSWMKPLKLTQEPAKGSPAATRALVEIPSSWYTEDATPLCFYPHLPSSQGYVSVNVVEKMWLDRFDWLWDNESWLDEGPGTGYGSVFPIILHPECAGRSHIIGMIDRCVSKLQDRASRAQQGEITFETMESVARQWNS